jgi:hypothetical protein
MFLYDICVRSKEDNRQTFQDVTVQNRIKETIHKFAQTASILGNKEWFEKLMVAEEKLDEDSAFLVEMSVDALHRDESIKFRVP